MRKQKTFKEMNGSKIRVVAQLLTAGGARNGFRTTVTHMNSGETWTYNIMRLTAQEAIEAAHDRFCARPLEVGRPVRAWHNGFRYKVLENRGDMVSIEVDMKGFEPRRYICSKTAVCPEHRFTGEVA